LNASTRDGNICSGKLYQEPPFVEHNTTRYGVSQVINAITSKIRLNAASESMWMRQRSSLHFNMTGLGMFSPALA
jgi:hypothetical protein